MSEHATILGLNITTWQREHLLHSINRQGVGLRQMRQALALVDKLELDPDEQEAVGYQSLPDGRSLWTDTNAVWDIEVLDGFETQLLQKSVQEFAHWPIAKADDAFDLAEQLGVELE